MTLSIKNDGFYSIFDKENYVYSIFSVTLFKPSYIVSFVVSNISPNIEKTSLRVDRSEYETVFDFESFTELGFYMKKISTVSVVRWGNTLELTKVRENRNEAYYNVEVNGQQTRELHQEIIYEHDDEPFEDLNVAWKIFDNAVSNSLMYDGFRTRGDMKSYIEDNSNIRGIEILSTIKEAEIIYTGSIPNESREKILAKNKREQ